KARAGPGAQGAALHPMGAVLGTAVGVHVERLVATVGVVVAEDVVGADHDAGRTTGAEPGRHHLLVEARPVELLGGHVGHPIQPGPGDRSTGGVSTRYRRPVPELLEVELYRQLATAALDRQIASLWIPDGRVIGRPATAAGLRRALVGRRFS